MNSFKTNWFDLLAVQGTLKRPPAPQFESINSLALSFIYDPTLTSIHVYWKNHIFDCTDLCKQRVNKVSTFLYAVLVVVFLFISPFMSLSICFVYLGAPTLDAYMLWSVISSSCINPFIIISCLSLWLLF